MPKRKTKKKPRLTLVEMLIIMAIGGIFLSIVIPAAKKAKRPIRRTGSARVALPVGPQQVPSNEGGSGLAMLALGVFLGIGGTLFYQRLKPIQVEVCPPEGNQQIAEDGENQTIH